MNANEFSSTSIAEFLSENTFMPVILCIGTDRVIGDALGPIAGELLVKTFNAPFFVYGTLSSPVTALTLNSALEFIRYKHKNRKIIAIDSSLGKSEDVGKIRLVNGGIRPGLATGKRLPVTGDLSVTATVAPKHERNALSSVRLGFVYRLSDKIARTLYLAAQSCLNAQRGRHEKEYTDRMLL